MFAVVRDGLSRNQAPAWCGSAVSTANTWVKRYVATGSLDHGQIVSYKLATLSGDHRDRLLQSCGRGGFTLHGLVVEVAAERSIKVDDVSV